MIFFSDIYNLLYYKMYDNKEKTMKECSIIKNALLYSDWKDYLTLKNEFLIDISNIIYKYQNDYKNYPSHSKSNLKDTLNEIEKKL